MTIGEAEAQIGKLQARNEELKRKIANCEKVIAALGQDQTQLSKLAGQASGTTSSVQNVGNGADTGQNAFSSGAFYVGQEEGTSQNFSEIGEKNGELSQAIQNIQNTIQEQIGIAANNIQIATQNMENYKNEMAANESEIASLRQWIEEERRRQEEERRRQESSGGDGGAADAYEEARQHGWGVFAK